MTPRLQDRHALLTGAGGGIGLAVLEAYLHEGARCSVVDLSAQASAGVQALAKQFPERLHYIGADITRSSEIARLVDSARAAFGSIEVLYNNAAVFDMAPRAYHHRDARINGGSNGFCIERRTAHMAGEGARIRSK